MNRRHFLVGTVAGAGLIGFAPSGIAQQKNVEGEVAAGWEAVRSAFAAGQAEDPGGAQLCVYRHGKRVVDLWTGWDVAKKRPYNADTLTIIHSSSKGVTATAAHMLVQQGRLDVDKPVAAYWPEFAANGKERVLVRHLLSHQSGLSAFAPDSGIGGVELLDWDRCVKALAAAKPMWAPGTAFRYHSVTFGYLVGEVVRRISGKSVGKFVADEFRTPLGLRLWIGDMPEAEEANFAPIFSTSKPRDRGAMMARAKALNLDMTDPLVQVSVGDGGAESPDSLAFFNLRASHLAEIPAANGISNARSLAKFYAAIIGTVDGVRLLNDDTINNARRPQTDGMGQPPQVAALGTTMPLRFGLGYELDRPNVPLIGPGGFGHTGAGGKYVNCDPESGVAVAYVANNLSWDYAAGPDARWKPWIAAIKAAVAA